LGIIDEIPPGGRVALDTSVLVYYIEEHDRYEPLLDPVFEAIDKGTLFAICSVVSLLEVLVGPLRSGHQGLVRQYRNLLTDTRRFSLVFVTTSIAEQAALLRAEHGLSMPDAVIAATAIMTRCDTMITNDSAFQRVAGFRTLLPSAFV
jgi:predicted nucleic acid-binding protein